MEPTATEYTAAVAAELRAERGRQDVTFEHLVAATGLSRASVIRYLRAQRDIPIGALALLCQALGVQVSVITSRAEAQLAKDAARA